LQRHYFELGYRRGNFLVTKKWRTARSRCRFTRISRRIKLLHRCDHERRFDQCRGGSGDLLNQQVAQNNRRSEEWFNVIDYDYASGKTIEAVEGTTLLAAILAAEVDLTHNCEGNAQCGTSISSFMRDVRVSKVACEENEKLDSIVVWVESRLPVSKGAGLRISRLSC